MKKLSKDFNILEFPRSIHSVDVTPREHKFGVDVYLHFIQSEEFRNPYVLIFNKGLTFNIAYDLIEEKFYRNNSTLIKEELDIIQKNLNLNKEILIKFWNDKSADCEFVDFLERI